MCALALALVLLAPVTGHILMYPWKDCGLAIFSMITLAHYINIIFTQGKWLLKKRNMLVCGLFLALTILIRHNAILFVFPLITALLILEWYRYKKNIFFTILTLTIVVFLIKVPVYHSYKVENPSNRIVETTGMCMVIMGNVVKNCPELLNEEIREFLYNVAPKESWEENYGTGSFNRVKFLPETNLSVIEETGIKQMLKYTFNSFKAAKMYSLQAFFRLTGMIWKLDGDILWEIKAFADVEKTKFTLNDVKQKEMLSFLENWKIYIDKSLLIYPMNYIGWFNLILIALALTSIREKKNMTNIFHVTPLLCYNFGTALLLTGFDWRFFYLNFPLIVPTIFLLVKDTQGITE